MGTDLRRLVACRREDERVLIQFRKRRMSQAVRYNAKKIKDREEITDVSKARMIIMTTHKNSKESKEEGENTRGVGG